MRRLSILLVLVLFALPLTAQAPAAQAPQAPEEFFFDSDGVRLRYVVEGQGDPVVLLHGITTSVESNWIMPGVFGKLADGFMVIGLDARGHGKSDKPHDPESYGAQMARDVVNLLDHLELQQAHIVGYSMGGFITMKLLTMAPERFLSAVVAGAGWSREDLAAVDVEALATSLEEGNGISPLIQSISPPDRQPPAEQLEMINRMIMATNDPLALAAVARGSTGWEVTEEELRANSVPTLLVIGDADPLKAVVDPLEGVMSEATFVVIEGADHMSAPGDPELAVAIRDFLISVCQCA